MGGIDVVIFSRFGIHCWGCVLVMMRVGYSWELGILLLP